MRRVHKNPTGQPWAWPGHPRRAVCADRRRGCPGRFKEGVILTPS